MRVAVLGVGSIGARHARNLTTLGHEAVLVDSDSERGAYRSLSTCCGLVDAAIIATPAAAHLELLRECIAWDLPVLVEKPVGVVADLDALRGLRPTKPVMIGYQLRFYPALQALKIIVPTPVCGYFSCACDARQWPGSAGHGDLLLEMSHEIDSALWYGAPQTVSEDELFVDRDEAEFSLGAYSDRWRVELGWRSSIYRRSWHLIGGGSEARHVLSDPGDLTQNYIDELIHFLRAVEGGPVGPGCTLEEAITVLDIVRQVKEQHV